MSLSFFIAFHKRHERKHNAKTQGLFSIQIAAGFSTDCICGTCRGGSIQAIGSVNKHTTSDNTSRFVLAQTEAQRSTSGFTFMVESFLNAFLGV